MASMAEPLLVWVDLEMTGLDAERDHVLQAAITFTGPDLQAGEEVVDLAVWQPEAVLDLMSPRVRRWHDASGLTARVRASEQTLAEVEAILLGLTAARCAQGEGILAGNSVWVDRRFLARHMPAFERYLHHRQLDVSSWKVMCQAWYGERARFEKPGDHTAGGDIRASIAELAFYRTLLRQEP